MRNRTHDSDSPHSTGSTASDAARTPHTPCNFAVPLADLSRGEVGVIDQLDLPEPEAGRLLRLGLVPGRTITVLRGGARPMVATAGARLALDRTLAGGLMVVKDGGAGDADSSPDALPDAALPDAFEPDAQEAAR